MADILCIDDDPDMLITLKAYLEDEGHTVSLAANGALGVDALASRSFDLALCDLRMPVMDGLTFLDSVRELSLDIPVIVVSGAGDIRDVVKAIRKGAWDYVFKPLNNMIILNHSIDKALERAHLLREQASYRRKLEEDIARRTAELERARQELYEQNMYLEALIQSIPMPVVVRDLAGRVLEANQAFSQWTGKDDMTGFNVFSHYDDDESRLLQEKDEELKAAGGRQVFEMTIAGQDKLCEVIVHRALVKNAAGQALGMVAVLDDVTERRQAERRAKQQEECLVQADKMISLGILTAGVAHEVNNPNHMIMLNASILRQIWSQALPALDEHMASNRSLGVSGQPYAWVRESVDASIAAILEGAERIRDIVAEMKDFARLEDTGEATLVDVNAVVDSAMRLTGARMRKSTYHFGLKKAPDKLLVRGNKQRLEQVVVNLLVNAAEALTDPSQAVEVRTGLSEDGASVTLCVSDEGAGMPPEVKERMLDPFFTTKRDIGGTGLGLAICERIVKRHGGKLRIDSEPGKGTAASVDLPACAPPAQTPAAC